MIKRNMLNRLGRMNRKQFVAPADSIREHNRLAKFNGETAFTDNQLAALATTLTPEQFLQKHKDILRQLKAGQSVRNVAKIVSKGISTVQRVKATLAA
jgi:hypothetical protein